jgi:hypothetical protein
MRQAAQGSKMATVTPLLIGQRHPAVDTWGRLRNLFATARSFRDAGDTRESRGICLQ